MIIEKVRKIIACVSIATYVCLYTAPMGMCVTAANTKLSTGVQKPALRAAAQPSIVKLEGDIAISKKNPKITLSLRDSDVKQVLRMLSDKAGLNIIFHSSVDTINDSEKTNAQAKETNNNSQSNAENNASPASVVTTTSTDSSNSNEKYGVRKVTMDLVNVPLNDAFKMILQVSGLTYYMEGNTLIITSADAAMNLNLAKQDLMIIPVKYVEASIIANFLNKNIFAMGKPGLSNANIAVTNPASNEILLFGTKNDYLMAKKIVAQFDKKPLNETFIVNNATPRVMANLICNLLLNQKTDYTKDPTSSGSGSSSSDSSGTVTGGASNTSSMNSQELYQQVDKDMRLGEGYTACTLKNNVAAGNLASLNTYNMKVNYFQQRGTIEIIGGTAQQLDLVKRFIAENDKKAPQAYLEVAIVELNEKGTKEFNNTWNIYTGFFSGTFDGTLATDNRYGTFFKGDEFTDVLGQKITKYSGPSSISYSMSYLLSNGKGRMLANPRIVVTNGQTSIIDLSSDYISSSKTDVSTTSGGTTREITYEIASDNGIMVGIKPFISQDGYVTLNISPSYSTIMETVPGTYANTIAATLLQRRKLQLSQVRIKDGETLVIGGLMNETEEKTVSKIPILGDLPGIGVFFRNSKNERKKNELVIMITPKIIKDTEEVVNTPIDTRSKLTL